ncbi:MAG: DUF3014 domain-containing protein [Gammaproteobacteria bacterium]|nr:DUF3014 domain-containing protein [Gammaproteobacteria bacterium]MBU1415506.1 DUF3014 domain-containing protein [Gammaproteobacteria bacterium]
MEPIHVDTDEVLLAARPELAEEGGGGRMVLAVIALVAAVAGGIYFWWQWDEAAGVPEEVTASQVAAPSPTPIVPQEEEVPAQNPVEESAAAEPLPALEESDATAANLLADLGGKKAVTALFLSDHVIQRIVATVDNLPRREAPVKVWPVKPLGSWFEAMADGSGYVVGPKNAARYAPYVKVVKALDAQKMAATYRQFYPLFQEAYRTLGFPKGHFNDRLVEAIDDLLETPEPKAPLRLVQNKVRYEFADPDLDQRSAGQKILLRMGVGNAQVVKAKLREFRQYVAKG